MRWLTIMRPITFIEHLADWSVEWPLPQMAEIWPNSYFSISSAAFSHHTVPLHRSHEWKMTSWLKGNDLSGNSESIPEWRVREVKAVAAADLWDGLDLFLRKIQMSFVPGLRAWRLMAGPGLSLARGGFGVETGLGRNGWEQRIMREICLKSNHWL